MGPGGIATIIAATSLLVIAFAIGYAIVRVGQVVDEVHETLKSVNRLIANAESITEKVTDSVSHLIEKNSGLLKIVGKLVTAFAGKKLSRSRGAHEEHE